jgi:hypothetical protein
MIDTAPLGLKTIVSPIFEGRLGTPAANSGKCLIGDAFGAVRKVSLQTEAFIG